MDALNKLIREDYITSDPRPSHLVVTSVESAAAHRTASSTGHRNVVTEASATGQRNISNRNNGSIIDKLGRVASRFRCSGQYIVCLNSSPVELASVESPV